MELYQDKEASYFSNTRLDLISVLPEGKIERLLEVGAGSGDTLVEIKRRGLANHVTGFELMKLPGTNQQNTAIDNFVHGDLEKINDELAGSLYDVIICGDVLEHLTDPWAILEKLKRLLRPGGTFIISCPNVRHYSMFVAIFLKGSFAYTDFGILDKTHLRFFCKKDLLNMVTASGLKSQTAISTLKFYPKSITYVINMLTFRIFEQFLSKQYIITAKSKV
ncbi:MAG TPA: methyltransferase domain-containing protein [Cyclobacteriaceae bacterium]|nr:methyltransferase domain-containing protein [Cyclobacteriaceae bacterium]